MAEPKKCTGCGANLPPDAPGGHCPQCLLKLASIGAEPPDKPTPTIRIELAPEPAGSEKPGDRIGRYKLLQLIGEGGMGAVWMAEQTEPVRRKVAVKVVKLGMDTRQVVARFEAERQALALMDHPNIAKVLDAGASDNGRPYFVMELVRGIRITDYCDQNNLSTRERLGLFVSVCQAVQHAHQKGIIHRDIKPSNILVTMNDGVPVPKVIDFGIAKATTDLKLTEKTLFTAFEQFIGTPAYMSPEQAEMSAMDIDTRSDIYSLGVLLYELLTGKTPFDSRELMAAGLDAMRRVIREKEPPRPSTRLSTLNEGELTTTAKHRQSEAPKLVHLIRGDLDWIVMKTLEKDRTRRYETANGLAADIGRYLADEPVEAGPPSKLYRLRKMVQRNKIAVSAGVIVLCSLIAGLGVSTWMYFKEQKDRRRAQTAEEEQSRLREEAEARAYSADMSLAARSEYADPGLGMVERILADWRERKPDRRGWEWYYLNGLCHRDLLTIDDSGNGIVAAEWSPDGARLASAGSDHSIKIWSATTGKRLAVLKGHAGVVFSMAWASDGKRIASAGADGLVRIWDADSERELTSLKGHPDQVRSVAWSHDGRKLASGGWDGSILIWNPVNGTVIQRLEAGADVQAIGWSRDDSKIAACGYNNFLKAWNSGESEPFLVERPDPGPGALHSLAWSPDGKWLATGGDDSALRLWDVVGKSNVVILRGRTGAVSSVAWNVDGTKIAATGHYDCLVNVVDMATGTVEQRLRGHAGVPRAVSWNPDGTRLMSAGLDGLIKLWDPTAQKDSWLKKSRLGDRVQCLAWHPDGKLLAMGGIAPTVTILDTSGAAQPVVLSANSNWVAQVAWNPAGTCLAAVGGDGLIKIWETRSGRVLWNLQASKDPLRAVAWSPDGMRLATAGIEDRVTVWDFATQQPVSRFPISNRVSLALAWSHDGSAIAIGTGNAVEVLDAKTGAVRWSKSAHTDIVRSIAWSPDDKILASAGSDMTVRLWDAAGSESRVLRGHVSGVYSLSWSPDGKRLASGSWDQTVRIWNPSSGAELCALAERSRTTAVESVAWCPDGKRIASVDFQGNLFIQDSAPGETAERR